MVEAVRLACFEEETGIPEIAGTQVQELKERV